MAGDDADDQTDVADNEVESCKPKPTAFVGQLRTMLFPALTTLIIGRLKITFRLACPMFPAASFAETTMIFVPVCKLTPVMLQVVVPLAVPPPPRLLLQVTCTTPTL